MGMSEDSESHVHGGSGDLEHTYLFALFGLTLSGSRCAHRSLLIVVFLLLRNVGRVGRGLNGVPCACACSGCQHA
eukprot:scaffold146322_cov34-Tisochrysis_lutea.AAC.1